MTDIVYTTNNVYDPDLMAKCQFVIKQIDTDDFRVIEQAWDWPEHHTLPDRGLIKEKEVFKATTWQECIKYLFER
ncbi:MAG: hypothetical protein GY743_23210 [Planctomycetaceae bacterium]|nr:hypothetical protein [Planctomycetaceae bacterium]